MPGLDSSVSDAEDGRSVQSGASDAPSAVHVRFVPAAGRRLRRPEPTSCPEKGPLWAERPLLIERASGAYELIGTSRNLDGLARWLLSFGTSATVETPDRLRRKIALAARRVWLQYDE